MTQPDEPGWVGSARRQAALPGPLRELHRAVLRRFLQTRRPPTTSWIAGAAARLGLSDSAVAELEAADLAACYSWIRPPLVGWKPQLLK